MDSRTAGVGQSDSGTGDDRSGTAPLIYFAYGSNLDLEQMRDRCPDSHPLGFAQLPGYRLAFGGYSTRRKGGVATVLPGETGLYVQGLLYQMTARDVKKLDMFEGVPTMYERVQVRVSSAEGQEVQALTYQLLRYRPKAPSDAYRDQIAAAFTLHGFDASLLNTALQL